MNGRTASEAADHPVRRADVLLAAVTDARAGWISAALTALLQHRFVTSVWLVGSLGRVRRRHTLIAIAWPGGGQA